MEEDSAEQPIRLIIRFTTSIPDLPLTVLTPSTITTVSLKQQIRTHLPPDSSRNRLRLIHSGKVLSDTTSLVTSLRLPPPPPPPPSRDIKGKAPIRRIQTLYIHCSISDPLSPADLAAEAALAASNDVSKRTEPASPSTHDDAASSTATTTPAPRGFDRLLTAGFTPTEIASLRHDAFGS
ncbi:hypothetical protein MMC06_002798 [Schaereria dolodes]|nr:hypothetical protein [Schaereria dolodes]